VLRLPVVLNVNGAPAAAVSARETAAVVERRRKAARRDGIFITCKSLTALTAIQFRAEPGTHPHEAL
jgi:hypothetical protein